VEQLLVRAKAGEEAALGELLQQFASYLEVLARVQIGRQLQGKVDPSDVVQDAFLEAHRHFPQFRGSSRPELVSWLRQILAGRIAVVMRRYLGTQVRNLRLEQQLEVDLAHSSTALGRTLAVTHSTPSQHVVKEEQEFRLAQALNGLPPQYREVIMLRQLQGLPFSEIAAQMNRSLDSVQKLWVRGLIQLREKLEEIE
jgi:RNA polymerase sigma-70 factor, ECF subfamily